ncbi:MAG: hypothetical protein GX801_08105 [Fibrobacter sp.]|nr:hypothetical protein [Fibrobacter sp.]
MHRITNPLLIKMLNEPLAFSDKDFDDLIASYLLDNKKYAVQKAFDDFRQCIRHIYDINEDRLKETSCANTGIMGVLNKRSTDKRQKKYFKRIANQKTSQKYVKIYVEGDSWFLFPLFVKDIVDWLSKNPHYLLYSDAYGGDWLTNIIYEGQYIEALTVHDPDVFLISGGGNDLVGNERLAVMVSGKAQQKSKHTPETLADISDASQRELILLAQPYITKDFYSFIWTLKAQFTMLFKGIYENTTKFKDMITITHGYAYPYPKKGNNFSLGTPLQPLVNKVAETGKWLFRPLMIKGILDPRLQQALAMTFIYEYNEMLIDLSKKFANVHHIDCRDIPQKQSDWYDELHLKSHKYKQVAQRYQSLIDSKFKT